MVRLFRGVRYEIDFKNPQGVQEGIQQILVDGKAIEGNLIPVMKKEVCKVTVIMGENE